MKKLLLLVALACVACAFFVFQEQEFMRFWKHWLVVSVPMEKADALIVLGGEPLARPMEAARLYKAGVAPRVFVTGRGDFGMNRRILLEGGVPPDRITVESRAITTQSNASLLKPMLEAAKVRSALIVTSPFHTRRALATFRKVMPDIHFGVTDASIGWWGKPEGRGDVNRFAAVEFLKTAEYWLLYGVSPVLVEGRGSEALRNP
ncbi:MAG: YdcF family protein [Verrucomicrobiota bacterium]